jgi:hypothetical protein
MQIYNAAWYHLKTVKGFVVKTLGEMKWVNMIAESKNKD